MVHKIKWDSLGSADITNEKTGKEFVIDKYPAGGEARYAVSRKYGEFIGKFRTLKGALEFVQEQK